MCPFFGLSIGIGYQQTLPSIIPKIPNIAWFNNLVLSKSFIIYFNCLHMGHHILPFHISKLNIKDSSFCTFQEENIKFAIYHISDIFFDYLSLFASYILHTFLISLNIRFYLASFFEFYSELSIKVKSLSSLRLAL